MIFRLVPTQDNPPSHKRRKVYTLHGLINQTATPVCLPNLLRRLAREGGTRWEMAEYLLNFNRTYFPQFYIWLTILDLIKIYELKLIQSACCSSGQGQICFS